MLPQLYRSCCVVSDYSFVQIIFFNCFLHISYAFLAFNGQYLEIPLYLSGKFRFKSISKIIIDSAEICSNQTKAPERPISGPSNIYDGPFSQNNWVKAVNYFCKKSSMVDVWRSSKICHVFLVSYSSLHLLYSFQANIYLLKVTNWNIGKRCEICSELAIKIPERRQWRCYGFFIVNFKHVTHLFLVFLMLALNM